MKYDNIVLVDCEARGPSAVSGTMTEFGAVHFASMATFHGVLFDSYPDPLNPAIPVVGERMDTDHAVAQRFAAWLDLAVGRRQRPLFVSDNPAFDWQWIAALFDRAHLDNPFGHSGRRISDFWAGMQGDWGNTQKWKRFRRTAHDHNPVNDSLGNAEALRQIFEILESGKAGLHPQPVDSPVDRRA